MQFRVSLVEAIVRIHYTWISWKSIIYNDSIKQSRRSRSEYVIKNWSHSGLNWGPCACKAHVITTTLWDLAAIIQKILGIIFSKLNNVWSCSEKRIFEMGRFRISWVKAIGCINYTGISWKSIIYNVSIKKSRRFRSEYVIKNWSHSGLNWGPCAC